jgi:hypothetical protein
MQRRELRAFAVAALLQLAAAFCGAAADAKAAPPSNGGAAVKGPNSAGADLRLRLLPAVHVLLLWAAGHPDVAGCAAAALNTMLLSHKLAGVLTCSRGITKP